jgi:hypothetical protein
LGKSIQGVVVIFEILERSGKERLIFIWIHGDGADRIRVDVRLECWYVVNVNDGGASG